MAEVARRFGWLVLATACYSAAAPAVDVCHHNDAQDIIGANWQDAVARACKYFHGMTAFACRDGKGHVMDYRGEGWITQWFDADGKLVGSREYSDGGTTCMPEMWGVVLACDTTPIDLACPVTN